MTLIEVIALMLMERKISFLFEFKPINEVPMLKVIDDDSEICYMCNLNAQTTDQVIIFFRTSAFKIIEDPNDLFEYSPFKR